MDDALGPGYGNVAEGSGGVTDGDEFPLPLSRLAAAAASCGFAWLIRPSYFFMSAVWFCQNDSYVKPPPPPFLPPKSPAPLPAFAFALSVGGRPPPFAAAFDAAVFAVLAAGGLEVARLAAGGTDPRGLAPAAAGPDEDAAGTGRPVASKGAAATCPVAMSVASPACAWLG